MSTWEEPKAGVSESYLWNASLFGGGEERGELESNEKASFKDWLWKNLENVGEKLLAAYSIEEDHSTG